MSDCCNDIVQEEGGLVESFEINGIGDIKVDKYMDGTKKIFDVSYDPYRPPVINATANPLKEVGDTYGFTWAVNIQPGREDIVTRSITPAIDPAPDLTAPFNVVIADQKKNSPQTVVYYTVGAIDSQANSITRQLSVDVVNKVFLGYSYKDGLTTGQTLLQSDVDGFTGTLAKGIKDIYGGTHSYVVPISGALQYIYLLYEAGTVPINAFVQNGLPFPVIFIPGTITVTNSHDNTITAQYSIVRSANKFGAGTLSLLML